MNRMVWPHTIRVEELEEWLSEDAWKVYASSGGPDSNKRLEASTQGKFRVTDHGRVTYLGDDKVAAVAAYNDAL